MLSSELFQHKHHQYTHHVTRRICGVISKLEKWVSKLPLIPLRRKFRECEPLDPHNKQVAESAGGLLVPEVNISLVTGFVLTLYT